jgi:flagellar biosynthetic protein FliR
MPVESLSAFGVFAWLRSALQMSVVLILLPLPGLRTLVPPARAFLALAIAGVLAAAAPSAPRPNSGSDWMGLLINDFFLGIGVGLAVTFVVEAFLFAGQVIATQAGFAYASTIDPFSEADSGLLPSLLSLAASLLFFQSPLYGALVRALIASSGRVENPQAGLALPIAQSLIRFSAHCLIAGLRLALPLIALLLLADLCIGLFGRLQPQVQVLTMSFSLKLLGAMAAVAALIPAIPHLYRQLVNEALTQFQFVLR